MERGLFITLHAGSRQIAAMPNEFYLLRLIHSVTRCCCPGERLWTANQLSHWVHVSATTLEPAVATQIGRQLARTYGGDIASADWRA